MAISPLYGLEFHLCKHFCHQSSLRIKNLAAQHWKQNSSINTYIVSSPCCNNNASCRVTIDLVRTQVCQSMSVDRVVRSEMSLMSKLDSSLVDKPPLLMAQWMIVLLHLLGLHWPQTFQRNHLFWRFRRLDNSTVVLCIFPCGCSTADSERCTDNHSAVCIAYTFRCIRSLVRGIQNQFRHGKITMISGRH